MTAQITRSAVSHRLGNQTVWWVDYELKGNRHFVQVIAGDADAAWRDVARWLGISGQ
jgi:hypothetical protein